MRYNYITVDMAKESGACDHCTGFHKESGSHTCVVLNSCLRGMEKDQCMLGVEGLDRKAKLIEKPGVSRKVELMVSGFRNSVPDI